MVPWFPLCRQYPPSLASLPKDFSSARDLSSPRAFQTQPTVLLRTRLSKPGERARRGFQPRELGEDFGLAGFLPREASSVSATERTWALRPPQSDGSAVVAVSMYKAVNKATPSKGAAGISTLVIRRPSATTLQGATSPWGAPRAPAAPARHPGWSVPFPALVTPLPAMDRAHGLLLYGAPRFMVHRASPFVAMW